MIRGLAGVIPEQSVEVGRYYLAIGYQGGPTLFQCVETDEQFEGRFRQKALLFTSGGSPLLELGELPPQGPFVVLDDVHTRIDPTSVSASAFTSSLQAGTFIVDGDQPIVMASVGWRGWSAVNLSTGRTVSQGLNHGWLSFTRWSLVLDDEAGEELTIASFSDESTP